MVWTTSSNLNPNPDPNPNRNPVALTVALTLTKVTCCSFVLGFATGAAVGMHNALLVSRPVCLHVHVHVRAHTHMLNVLRLSTYGTMTSCTTLTKAMWLGCAVPLMLASCCPWSWVVSGRVFGRDML